MQSENNDLISREALKEDLHNFFDGKVIDEPAYILRDVFCYIEGAPTVDIESVKSELNPTVTCWYDFDRGYEKGYERGKSERPQGEWEPNSFQFECNLCENLNAYKSNFCPNCGADMRSKTEEGTE